jgi:predicted outer membrane protein
VKGNDEIHRLVNAIALKNASEHSGKTNVNTVLSRILSLKPELKRELKTLIEEIRAEVDSVNKLDLEQQKKLLDEIKSIHSNFDTRSKHHRNSSGYSISTRA